MAESHRVKGRLQGFESRLSQSSLEYLLVVALTFAIIIPTTYLFYSYSRESRIEIADAQIIKLGRGIIDASETIFYSGQGSKTTIEVNVPDNVESAVLIDGRELVFNVTTDFGMSEIVFFSSVNLTANSCSANVCSLPALAASGLKRIKMEAVSASSVRIEVV